MVVVGAEIRLALRRFLEPSFPRITILSYQELPTSTEVENAGIIPIPPALVNTVAPVRVAA